MFGDMTYEIILRRMLDRVDEWARERGIGVDTREGSLIRTALSPAAAELQQMYAALGEVMDESFADTQTRDFLIRRCKERGIAPYPATFAIRRGEFNMSVPIGSRYSLNKLNYTAIGAIENNAFQMRCETAGDAGNLESGDLIPIDYIDGLTFARLTGVLIPGEDDEDAEHLRRRYFDSLNAQAFGGNVRDYVEKTLAIDGVGAVKVYPVWDGGGTVKLVILDAQYNAPSQILIDAVQTAVDPIQNQGVGMGFAPIGHVVTAAGAGETMVGITTRIAFEPGWGWDALLPYAQAAVDLYFADLSREWPDSANIIVRISQIETRLLGLTGVLDVQNTTLNGEAANLEIDPDNIPVRGAITND
jgi:uncharacterized phage protein gp47/JayE